MSLTTTDTAREQHLALLEKVLTFSLWPEPPRPVSITARRDIVAHAAAFVDRQLKRFGLRLCVEKQIDREIGKEWPLLAHTMVGRKRLENIREACECIEAEAVPGVFVECGAWRGGASMYARACLPAEREVIACDSFQGLPFDPSEPEWARYEILRVSLREVVESFNALGLNYNVRFVKGWFSDTLPTLNEPIAILRADGDMYSSTMQILGNLYDKVSDGGWVIIDDYWLPRCKQAVDDYRKVKHIAEPMRDIDGQGVYWRKGI